MHQPLGFRCCAKGIESSSGRCYSAPSVACDPLKAWVQQQALLHRDSLAHATTTTTTTTGNQQPNLCFSRIYVPGSVIFCDRSTSVNRIVGRKSRWEVIPAILSQDTDVFIATSGGRERGQRDGRTRRRRALSCVPWCIEILWHSYILRRVTALTVEGRVRIQSVCLTRYVPCTWFTSEQCYS